MKKYLFEFLAIFVGVFAAFGLEEYRETINEREQTLKALNFIYTDIYIDSMLYNVRIADIDENTKRLERGLNRKTMSIDDFKELHEGLRSAVEYKVYDFGINYLRNNIQQPKLKYDSILTMVDWYYTQSSEEGNYGRLNSDYWTITTENYIKLFEVFPNFFSTDTTLANNEIRRNLSRFLGDPYWQGRINLTYRENSGIIKYVFEKNQRYNAELMLRLRSEKNN